MIYTLMIGAVLAAVAKYITLPAYKHSEGDGRRKDKDKWVFIR